MEKVILKFILDTCQGDSGGPLITEVENKKQILVGVTSFGISCALPSLPGIYTKISGIQPWLNKQLNLLSSYKIVQSKESELVSEIVKDDAKVDVDMNFKFVNNDNSPITENSSSKSSFYI